jgi:succinate dehydrogenase / fumarate reductase, cytochrome b subunit
MADTSALSPKAPKPRPLSPHLQIYAWTWTMGMSIFHRITGTALYAGTVLLAAWLIALAGGKASFECAQWLANSLIGRLVLVGYTWALFHHMLGGIRHFVWDMGKGYDACTRRNMALFTLVGSVCLTAALWAYVWFGR